MSPKQKELMLDLMDELEMDEGDIIDEYCVYVEDVTKLDDIGVDLAHNIIEDLIVRKKDR